MVFFRLRLRYYTRPCYPPLSRRDLVSGEKKSMSIGKIIQALACLGSLALFSEICLAQNVTSTIIGRVVDPANAVLAAAPVTLTNQDLGSVRSAATDSTGTFRFADVAPGTYTIAVQASGFKAFKEQNIAVSASETRDIGKLGLELGNVTESISVTAEATPIQLASSEKAQLIDANQLENVTLKGRDLFGYMKLAPGLVTSRLAVSRSTAIR